jgi:Copper amine oxidase, enzyme domain
MPPVACTYAVAAIQLRHVGVCAASQSVSLLRSVLLPPGVVMSSVYHCQLVCHRYVQAAAFLPSYSNSFGYPLIYNISGTLHTHVLAWKVDLDVGGTSNSVNIHTMKVRMHAAGNRPAAVVQWLLHRCRAASS